MSEDLSNNSMIYGIYGTESSSAIMPRTTLWILPEGRKSASKYPSKHIKPDGDLDDLRNCLCGSEKFLKTVEPSDIEFFSHDNRNEPLGGDILLKDITTTAAAPLIIRYPVSV